MCKSKDTGNISKLIGIACFFIIVSVIIAGCKEKEVEVLKFRITWDAYSGRGEAIQLIVDDYNEVHNDVKIELVSGDEDRSNYIQALNEDVIDVYVVPYRYMYADAIVEELMPLTMAFEEQQFYYENIIELAKSDEELMGIPWIGHSMALVYNKDLVAEAGIDPRTWQSVDDLLEGCRVVEEKTDASGIGLIGAECHDVTWMVDQFIYSFGGELLNSQGDIAINSGESQAALEFYINQLGKYGQEGWQDHTGAEVLDAFGKGEIAFEIQGPWAISDIWKKGSPFEVGAVSLPQIGMYSEVGPMMLAVSKESENREQAIEFIKFMVSKKSLAKIMNGEYVPKYDAYYPFRVPIRRDIVDSTFFKQYAEFYPFVEGFKQPSISTPGKKWEAIQAQNYAKILHEMIKGYKTIKEGLEEIG